MNGPPPVTIGLLIGGTGSCFSALDYHILAASQRLRLVEIVEFNSIFPSSNIMLTLLGQGSLQVRMSRSSHRTHCVVAVLAFLLSSALSSSVPWHTLKNKSSRALSTTLQVYWVLSTDATSVQKKAEQRFFSKFKWPRAAYLSPVHISPSLCCTCNHSRTKAPHLIQTGYSFRPRE